MECAIEQDSPTFAKLLVDADPMVIVVAILVIILLSGPSGFLITDSGSGFLL